MNYKQYQDLFQEILEQTVHSAPYDKKAFLENVRLNQARMKTWDDTLELSPELVAKLRRTDRKEHWIMIAEPWCIEAAHIIPFLVKMAAASRFITYDIQLRDSEPFLINAYLTNGSKGIPKMVARDENNEDLFVWGPRPAAAQTFRDQLSAADSTPETIKQALLQWYTADQGRALNTEILRQYQCTPA